MLGRSLRAARDDRNNRTTEYICAVAVRGTVRALMAQREVPCDGPLVDTAFVYDQKRPFRPGGGPTSFFCHLRKQTRLATGAPGAELTKAGISISIYREGPSGGGVEEVLWTLFLAGAAGGRSAHPSQFKLWYAPFWRSETRMLEYAVRLYSGGSAASTAPPRPGLLKKEAKTPEPAHGLRFLTRLANHQPAPQLAQI